MVVAASALPSGVLLHLSLSSSSSAGIRAVVRMRQPQGQGQGQRQQRRRGDSATNLAWVVRQDKEFIAKMLEPAAAPLSRLRHQVSKVLENFFWFRFLEEEGVAQWTPPSWPTPSYPGLSGMDLVLADIEALMLYANYPRYISKALSVSLPETYDPQTVEHYFRFRPHILAVRIFEVFCSFASAAIRSRASRNTVNRHHGEEGDDVDASQYFMGQLLKESMLNLGPTFIKVGQSLSTRPDIIGSGIAKALSELYDRVPPFPRPIAMKIIEDELGCSVEHAFSYVSDETVAAASFGQVYRGCTHDGCAVAIKVQRPGLLHAVQLDIYILRLGLGIIRKIARRKSDPRLYADELGKGFVGELDYRLEASNAIEFKEAHANYPFISVPKVFRHLTGKKVLTMEWLAGENPRDLLTLSRRSARDSSNYMKQSDARKRVLDLVNKGVEATLVQLLDTGILHADLHPGNLRYTSEGNIGFLDFGLLSRMQKKHQVAMLGSIVHIVNGDWVLSFRILLKWMLCHQVLISVALGGVALKEGIPDVKFSKVLGKIWSIAFQYHFSMPPYYVLVLRSLASLKVSLAVASDQDFKSFRAAYPYVVQKLLYNNSAATRRILYSHSSSDAIFDVAELILKLLPSKDGVVLRRILMDGDASSLARAMVSDKAAFVRQHVGRALADVIYLWMTGVMTRRGVLTEYKGNLLIETHDTFSGSFSPLLIATMRDRRVKVIVYRVVNIIRHNPMLLLRVCWTAIVVCLSSSALALHRLLVRFLEKYVTSSLPFPHRLFAAVTV
ncbi:unnamed protein product [Spirodela intermedia]|uniref:Protein kinase domain-containing protein n=1 Tax=Spirodela intermedia TaxID=51605 RepID=A0A7I8IBP7_SPIIN|nr:unnamed protein product [Spirodela intermedia]CAA6655155.1 unnamed protein product [Spirodela intermedia]